MLRVRFNGALREIAGRRDVEIPLPASRRLGDLLDLLVAAYPGILGGAADLQWRYGSSHVVVAVNGRVAADWSTGCRDIELADGDEVALLPPLGGG